MAADQGDATGGLNGSGGFIYFATRNSDGSWATWAPLGERRLQWVSMDSSGRR